MTILEAQYVVLEHFVENTTIDKGQLNQLCSKSKTRKAEDLAAFLGALEDLVISGIIKKIEKDKSIDSDAIWVLKKPLSLYEQNVIIDGQTAIEIANIIREFSDAIKSEDISANPLGIQQKDIIMLMQIINMYASAQQGKQDTETTKEDLSDK